MQQNNGATSNCTNPKLATWKSDLAAVKAKQDSRAVASPAYIKWRKQFFRLISALDDAAFSRGREGVLGSEYDSLLDKSCDALTPLQAHIAPDALPISAEHEKTEATIEDVRAICSKATGIEYNKTAGIALVIQNAFDFIKIEHERLLAEAKAVTASAEPIGYINKYLPPYEGLGCLYDTEAEAEEVRKNCTVIGPEFRKVVAVYEHPAAPSSAPAEPQPVAPRDESWQHEFFDLLEEYRYQTYAAGRYGVACKTKKQVEAFEAIKAHVEDLCHEPQPVAEQHPDDKAVDTFAIVMKARLASCRAAGRHGWETEECKQQYLCELLYHNIDDGDPLDVANFCMMLYQRGEKILPAAAPVAKPVGSLYSDLRHAITENRNAIITWAACPDGSSQTFEVVQKKHACDEHLDRILEKVREALSHHAPAAAQEEVNLSWAKNPIDKAIEYLEIQALRQTPKANWNDNFVEILNSLRRLSAVIGKPSGPPSQIETIIKEIESAALDRVRAAQVVGACATEKAQKRWYDAIGALHHYITPPLGHIATAPPAATVAPPPTAEKSSVVAPAGVVEAIQQTITMLRRDEKDYWADKLLTAYNSIVILPQPSDNYIEVVDMNRAIYPPLAPINKLMYAAALIAAAGKGE